MPDDVAPNPLPPILPRLHVVVTTHTTRHLDACLAGLAAQTLPPASLTLTCDGTPPELVALADARLPRLAAVAAWERTAVLAVFRAHTGISRQAQTRNNALRALDAANLLHPADAVLFFDGDIVAPGDTLRLHAQRFAAPLAGRGIHLALGHRAELSDEDTQRLLADPAVSWHGDGTPPIGGLDAALAGVMPSALPALHARDVRARRQLLARRWGLDGVGLLKAHKPKLISCHAAVRVAALREVNGFDETFEGHGYEDDDLGLRLHRLGVRTAVVLAAVPVAHLFHPTRKPADPATSWQHAHFVRRRDTHRASPGWDAPKDQPTPTVRRYDRGAGGHAPGA